MKKINLTIGALLLGSVVFASNFVACGGSDSNGTPGTAGTTGAGGTTGVAGTGSGPTDAGVAGTSSAPVDASGAMLADGRCASGAFRRDGVCSCQTTMPTVCGDSCVDMQADNNNCGACGHKCAATSACAKGVCGAEVTNVLPKIAGCGDLTIAVSGDKIYYADQTHGTIGSVPAAGGAATPLTGAQTEKLPTAIGASGTTVLWINNVPGAAVDGGAPPVASTLRKSVAGGAPVDLVPAITAPGGGIRGFVLSADGATVYYSTANFVKSIPLAGGASVTIANEEHGGIPGALGLEGTKLVYPTDGNGDVDVVTITAGVARCGKEDATKPGGYDMENCVRIARSQGSLRKQVVFAFGGWAYWIDSPSVKSGELVPPGTPSNDQVGATQNSIQGMATNKTNIYFSDTDTSMPGVATGMIWKTGINKAQLETTQVPIARGQMSPTGVAVGATKVFWVADCAINSSPL